MTEFYFEKPQRSQTNWLNNIELETSLGTYTVVVRVNNSEGIHLVHKSVKKKQISCT